MALIEGVIYLPDLKSVNKSILRPLAYLSNNLISAINQLEVMDENNCYKIVCSCSATIYGFTEEDLINE